MHDSVAREFFPFLPRPLPLKAEHRPLPNQPISLQSRPGISQDTLLVSKEVVINKRKKVDASTKDKYQEEH